MNFLPENISTYGGQIDSLIVLITIIGGIAFFIAEALLLGFVVFYRKKEGKEAKYIKGDVWKQTKWVLLPLILVVLLDLAIDLKNHSAWATIKQDIPQADIEVGITGMQFNWLFYHAGPDGKMDTDDDIQTPGELHVPVDSNVVFRLRSKDVLHSFWVPTLRLKQDAVPGRTIFGWFNATKPGTYEIACAEICGVAHGLMKANLVVHEKAEYEQWLAGKGAAATATAAPQIAPEHEATVELMQTKLCFTCHTMDGTRLIGPSYKGLFGKQETVVTGGVERTITVDEEYLRKSITDPMADVVAGFPPAMPPQANLLTPEELDQIVDFLKTQAAQEQAAGEQ